ncbi:MAG: nucleotidyl transferase AbiEii/AbiGii toxin family protein [Candidatus Eisenbacteria sp.]|nr:nucleotidyl transferase AbiEii/AbiGii toxin family protein [Candidatus Eisenbacteria bacterium]
MIPERDQRILLDLAHVADQAGIRFFIIGAGARLLMHDWALGVSGGRTTTDWDIAVQVPSWVEFERFRTTLLDFGDGAFAAGRTAHQLLHRMGGSVDIIPFGNLEVPAGTITWPSDGQQMSVAVFSACESLCQSVDLPGGITIRAATVPALVVMKAHAHAERFVRGESRDLRDIDFLLRTYAEHFEEERIFDLAASLLASGELLIDDAGAYLLGADIAASLDLPVLEPLHSLILQAAETYGTIVDTLVGPTWDDGEDALRRAAWLVRRPL